VSENSTAGEQLRQRIEAEAATNSLALDNREQALLDQACNLADTIAMLELALVDEPPVTRSQRGQSIVSPLITELRQSRLALLRLLGAIDLHGAAAPTASQRGRHAANARWHGHGRKTA